MPLLQHIHGGNLTRAAVKYGIPVNKIIDFSANINPLGPSPRALAALRASLDQVCHYPDPDCTELRAALAAYLGAGEDFLLMGNGAAELIYLLVRVTGCRRALVPVPTFCEYALAVLSQGGEVEEVPMNPEGGFPLPVQEIVEKLDGTDILFLCNPNNPTGRLIERGVIEYILERAISTGTLVVIDEAFIDFVPGREKYTMVRQLGSYRNLAVLYSLTKFFGIPGLRLGAIAGPRELVARMAVAKDPWNVNILAQVAGTAGLHDREYMENTNSLVREEKQFLFKSLSALKGLKPLPGAANFLLVEVSGTGYSSGQLTDRLGSMGILVRDCEGFPGLDGCYLRLAVKTRQENEKLILALKQILGGYISWS